MQRLTRKWLPAASILVLAATVMTSCAQAQEDHSCASHSDCGNDEFCNTTPQCPGPNVAGVCTVKPQLCTMDYRPVTGCNGKEYSNACAAASDGQSNTGPAK